MNLREAERLANRLIDEHEIDWTFQWDRSVRRFGCCHYGSQVISMSRKLAELNDEARVRDTILHEIAHALDGPYTPHHGPSWRAIARRIGAEPKACYKAAEVVTPAPAWVGTCPKCGHETFRHRLTTKTRKRSCGRCATVYDPERLFVWRRNRRA